MSDRDAGEEMVSELGIDPAVDIDDRQRYELLREWHKEDAEKAEAEKHRAEKERDEKSGKS